MQVITGASIKRWLLVNFRKKMVCRDCQGDGEYLHHIYRRMKKCSTCKGTGIRWHWKS